MSKREKIIGVFMLIVIMLSALMYKPSKKDREKQRDPAPVKRTALSGKKAQNKADARPVKSFDIVRIAQRIKLMEQDEENMTQRDPFAKLEPKFAPLSFNDLVLTGISFEDEEPVAVINDQILRVGDVFSGFELIEIRENEVVLSQGIGRYILKFTAEKKNK